MILYTKKSSVISSTLIGIVFGVLSNYSILLGSWLNLIIWGVIGLLIGLFIENKQFVRQSGIFYGLFLVISFLVSGFHGTADKIVGFTLLSVVLGEIGAVCGWVLVFV